MPIFFSKPGSYPVDSRGIAYTLGFFSSKRLGTGQFYLITFKDKAAHALDGGGAYRLNDPINPPGGKGTIIDLLI